MPTATVSSPPHTAANRIATPSGKFQCQPKKSNFVESVFCMMKINSTIRIRNPMISADHNAAARVKLTADSGRRGIPGRRCLHGCGGIGRAGTAAAAGRATRTDRWSWVHLCPFARE